MAKRRKVIIKTHDGKERETYVDNYDAKEIADQLNDNQKTLVVIGDIIVHRSTVAGVIPID